MIHFIEIDKEELTMELFLDQADQREAIDCNEGIILS